MSRDVKAVPEGQRTITPHLVASDADGAIAFYRRAFGATELGRMLCPQTGRVMHAALQIGDSRLFICDEFPECPSQGSGGSAVTIHLYVDDADATVARAAEAGAKVDMPVTEMFWGDRYGKLTDPFGHSWSVATHVEDLTREQMAERMAAAFATAS